VKRFRGGQRVLVLRAAREGFRPPFGEPGSTAIVNRRGTVRRLRHADDAAWIALDERSDTPDVHAFPADDSRGTHVLAMPEWCDEVAGGAS
jgi:hypothetical protein